MRNDNCMCDSVLNDGCNILDHSTFRMKLNDNKQNHEIEQND